MVWIGSVVLEKNSFECRQCTLLFRYDLTLEKRVSLHFKKLRSPSPWSKFTNWFFRGRFLNVVKVISLFRDNLPLKNKVALRLYKFQVLYYFKLYSLSVTYNTKFTHASGWDVTKQCIKHSKIVSNLYSLHKRLLDCMIDCISFEKDVILIHTLTLL